MNNSQANNVQATRNPSHHIAVQKILPQNEVCRNVRTNAAQNDAVPHSSKMKKLLEGNLMKGWYLPQGVVTDIPGEACVLLWMWTLWVPYEYKGFIYCMSIIPHFACWAISDTVMHQGAAKWHILEEASFKDPKPCFWDWALGLWLGICLLFMTCPVNRKVISHQPHNSPISHPCFRHPFLAKGCVTSYGQSCKQTNKRTPAQ